MPSHLTRLREIPEIPRNFFAKGSHRVDLLKVIDLIERHNEKDPCFILVCSNGRVYLAINACFQRNHGAIQSVRTALLEAAKTARQESTQQDARKGEGDVIPIRVPW